LIVFFNTADIASAGVGRVQRNLSSVTIQTSLFQIRRHCDRFWSKSEKVTTALLFRKVTLALIAAISLHEANDQTYEGNR
jgi:hypothetical protein